MNTKMKVLSLAVAGLAGFAFAGSAFAGTCPASPVPPWTAVSQFQGTATIVAGGLGGTACRLDSDFNNGASGAASATVEDDSPATEPRYRAAFIIDLDGLASPTINTSASIFSGNSTATGAGVKLSIFGNSGSWFLSYKISDGSGVFSNSVPLAAGENHVEFDLQIGATGSLTLWVNNNVEGSPTQTSPPVDNSADTGIDTAFLGLAAPSVQFSNTYHGHPTEFDQFDSRRSTFIGF
ncbi:MAG: hypothetical protein WB784_11260 [Rhodanobacteraceae bacterium]